MRVRSWLVLTAALSGAGHAGPGSAATRTVNIGARGGTAAAPLRIECPVNQPTRLVISRPFRRLVVRPPTAVDPMGISLVAARPEGIVRIQPVKHPLTAEMHIQLADRALVLVLKTTAAGVGSDLRLQIAEPAPAKAPPPPAPSAPMATPTPARVAPVTASSSTAPTPVPQPSPTLVPSTPRPPPPSSPRPTAIPTPKPTATLVPRPSATPMSLAKPSSSPSPAVTPSRSASVTVTPTPSPGPSASPAVVASVSPSSAPSPSPSVNLEGLLSAKPVTIGRREGLPGQKPMILDDALKGERSVWFRLTLLGGAKEKIARVAMGKTAITSFTQKPAGGDLRVVVQVATEAVTKDASLTFELEGGRKYYFPKLTTPTLTNLLKRF